MQECRQREADFLPEKDYEFFTDEPQAWIRVCAGNFVIFFPEDAHAPLCGEGQVHKVVLKVAVDY
jgi:biofilm protein TabA